jgi:hypothetical protein
MSDLICRKSMMRCQTPGMCSPHGGCGASTLVHTNVRYDSKTSPAVVDAERGSAMTNEELKALAEKASPIDEWYKPGDLRYADDKSGEIHGIHHDDDSFIAAANPAAVLGLIKDAERNQRMLLAACMGMGAIGEALGADMNSDGDELLGMVNDLKAQNGRMREFLKDIGKTSGDKWAVMVARQLLKEFDQ